jgi:hypothetical protein
MESYYNDLERQYNQIDSRRLDSNSTYQQQESMNSQNLSFLNQSKQVQYMPADNRQSHLVQAGHKFNNTI